MMKLVLFTLVALHVKGILSQEFDKNEISIVEYGSVLPERFCSSPGVMCKNCTTSVVCIEVDESIFEEHAPDQCPTGQTCLETKCVDSNLNPHCSEIADYEFPCSSVGVFPDQLDCRKFHLCVPTIINGEPAVKNYDAECSTGYKYNAKSTYCDKKLVNNRCFDNISEFPVPLCLKNGAMGAISENPSIFYVCEYYIIEETTTPAPSTEPSTEPASEPPGLKSEWLTVPSIKFQREPILYPYLYLCAHGKIFDIEQLKCVDPPKLLLSSK